MEKSKRVLALVALIFEVGFIIWMCFEAFTSKPGMENRFMASIVAAVGFPILLYVYLFVAKILKGKGVSKDEKVVDNNNNDK